MLSILFPLAQWAFIERPSNSPPTFSIATGDLVSKKHPLVKPVYKTHFYGEFHRTFLKVKTRKKLHDFIIGFNYYYNNIVNTCSILLIYYHKSILNTCVILFIYYYNSIVNTCAILYQYYSFIIIITSYIHAQVGDPLTGCALKF